MGVAAQNLRLYLLLVFTISFHTLNLVGQKRSTVCCKIMLLPLFVVYVHNVHENLRTTVTLTSPQVRPSVVNPDCWRSIRWDLLTIGHNVAVVLEIVGRKCPRPVSSNSDCLPS